MSTAHFSIRPVFGYPDTLYLGCRTSEHRQPISCVRIQEPIKTKKAPDFCPFLLSIPSYPSHKQNGHHKMCSKYPPSPQTAALVRGSSRHCNKQGAGLPMCFSHIILPSSHVDLVFFFPRIKILRAPVRQQNQLAPKLCSGILTNSHQMSDLDF